MVFHSVGHGAQRHGQVQTSLVMLRRISTMTSCVSLRRNERVYLGGLILLYGGKGVLARPGLKCECLERCVALRIAYPPFATIDAGRSVVLPAVSLV